MNKSADFSCIAELDLTPIKKKLMHVPSGEGWSVDYTEQVEKQYRRFLFLMRKYPKEHTAPLVDVDIFWHYHILDTMKYASDCERVFGYFLHHHPYNGMGDEADSTAHRHSAQRMQQLYEMEFDEPYLGADRAKPIRKGESTTAREMASTSSAAGDAAMSEAAFCGAAVNTAESGVTAFTASQVGRAALNTSAFCGATVEASAFCGATVDGSAFCGATVDGSASSRAPLGNGMRTETAVWSAIVAARAGSWRPTLNDQPNRHRKQLSVGQHQ
ncbi:MAG: glycine-rich domain-containing protein-like [Massilia sp.]